MTVGCAMDSRRVTIGVPVERRRETVKSFIVLKEGHTATARELIEYSRKELAADKIPRQIEFRDELPKSTVLRILRRELRQQDLAKLNAKAKV